MKRLEIDFSQAASTEAVAVQVRLGGLVKAGLAPVGNVFGLMRACDELERLIAGAACVLALEHADAAHFYNLACERKNGQGEEQGARARARSKSKSEL